MAMLSSSLRSRLTRCTLSHILTRTHTHLHTLIGIKRARTHTHTQTHTHTSRCRLFFKYAGIPIFYFFGRFCVYAYLPATRAVKGIYTHIYISGVCCAHMHTLHILTYTCTRDASSFLGSLACLSKMSFTYTRIHTIIQNIYT